MRFDTDNWTEAFERSLPVEERFVLRLAAGTPTLPDESEWKGLPDWTRLVEVLAWHKLDGYAYPRLSSDGGVPGLPETFIKELRMRHHRNAARAAFLESELAAILRALADQRIDAIVLKGMALTASVYRDPGVRPMSDIDLLVRQPREDQAQEIVASLGYRAGGPAASHDATRKYHRHLPMMVGIGKRNVVEVHRHVVRLDSPLCFDIGEFWDRAVPHDVAGERALILSPEDQIVHLCVNFLMDRRFSSVYSLGQLVDIKEVVASADYAPDWEAFTRIVDETGLHGPVGCALSLANLLVKAGTPDRVIEHIAPDLEADTLSRFARGRVVTGSSFIARDLVPAGKRYGRFTFARAMLRRLFPSRHYMLVHYGAPAGRLGLASQYWTRLRQGLRLVRSGAARPQALRDDLALDRWMHSLQRLTPRPSGLDISKKAVS